VSWLQSDDERGLFRVFGIGKQGLTAPTPNASAKGALGELSVFRLISCDFIRQILKKRSTGIDTFVANLGASEAKHAFRTQPSAPGEAAMSKRRRLLRGVPASTTTRP
jgi:hypothetical protein